MSIIRIEVIGEISHNLQKLKLVKVYSEFDDEKFYTMTEDLDLERISNDLARNIINAKSFLVEPKE